MIERTCESCGETYATNRSVRLRYCSMACMGVGKRRGGDVTCEHCGAVFYAPPSTRRRYCSPSCSTTARNLTDANPSKRRDISGERNPMYGRGRSGAANPMHGRTLAAAPRWKGGRYRMSNGYIVVVAPPGHPHPAHRKASGTAYILEHRLVMERALGRFLEPQEVVHHKDHDRANNDIGNLELAANKSDHMRRLHS